MTEAEDTDRGTLIAQFRPWNVGVNLAGIPVTAGFPGPRRFAVYENGLFLLAMTVSQFVPRHNVLLIKRAPLGIRLHWEFGAGEGIAFLTTFRRVGILRALDTAGYEVE